MSFSIYSNGVFEIFDISLPALGGILLTRRLRSVLPATRVLVFTLPRSDTYYLRLDPIGGRTGGYRLRTGIVAPGGAERARDHRDVFVAARDRRGRWETPTRVNDSEPLYDDWLPEEMAEAGPTYRQNLLHCDPAERFSIVSFVWGPGQATPIHDHTVWGLIGLLRGAEISQDYRRRADGGLEKSGQPQRLETGVVTAVSPTLGDIHQVFNAYDDRVSIGIHVYGADIGAVDRSVFTPEGAVKPFRSGYANAA